MSESYETACVISMHWQLSAKSDGGGDLLRHVAGDRFDVFSAGTRPAGLNPNAVRAMAEIGINIAGSRSKSVDEFTGQQFDYVFTVCDSAKESCPIFPGGGRRPPSEL